ncbi:MAG: S8 family peptidase [Prevotella sp.]|jgi:hypothetical protein|nr:S8 family peptidase [Prevotella sp.]MCH4100614.1 S8 family peptidase [Prevotella sp.]MCI1473303.1 S8 family peptidase [Prevotella sp.]MCI1518440.1 S8 family peptidase [Prevotella sp.]
MEFSPKSSHGTAIPVRDVHEQASRLRAAYFRAIEEAKTRISHRESNNLPASNGMYLDVNVGKKLPLPYAQLDSARKGARLLCVKENKDENGKKSNSCATIFLPESHENWFPGKIKDYETKKTTKDKPKNHSLIDVIDDIKPAQVRSLFPRVEEYDTMQDEVSYTLEVWIDETNHDKVEDILSNMEVMGFEIDRDNMLYFEQVTIVLADAVKETIDNIPYALDNIEAVKLYCNPVEMLQDNQNNRDWSKLIVDNVDKGLDEKSPRVSIIDRGVNNGNRLLTEFLPDNKCFSVVDDIPLKFEDDHGTGMAGLVLYGDLTEDMWKTGRHVVNHDLASVKIQFLSFANEPRLYGKLTKNAIEKSEEAGAEINCMAITEDKECNDGTPTSWSASIDDALYDDGKCDRMMILSAGDTPSENIKHGHYLDNLNVSSVQTPCEALNAIVVGSCTRKIHSMRRGYIPEALSGGISPLSRTAMLWRGKNAKPDIVMEGGNLGYKTLLGDSTMPELSLVTTSSEIPQKPLQDFNATSASAALAARLAAKIKYANPEN